MTKTSWKEWSIILMWWLGLPIAMVCIKIHMMKTSWWIVPMLGVLALLAVACIVSLVFSIRWLFYPQPLEYIRKRAHPLVFVAAFMCLVGLLIHGTERVLFFIPAEWGTYDNDGGFVLLRGSLAYLLAIGIAALIAYGYYKLAVLRDENFTLKIAVETADRLQQMRRYWGLWRLLCEEAQIRAERDALEERQQQGQSKDVAKPPRIVLSAADAIQLNVLDGLLAELPTVREEVADKEVQRRLEDLRELSLPALVDQQCELQDARRQLKAQNPGNAALSPEDEAEYQILDALVFRVGHEIERRRKAESSD